MEEREETRGNGHAAPVSTRLYERGRHVQDEARKVAEDAKGLASAVQELVDEAEESLRSQLEARPWAILGGAALAGWVLGAGMSSRILGIFVRVGIATAAQRLIARRLGELGEESPL